MSAGIAGLTVAEGELVGGESAEERVFSTARAALDAAALEKSDVDAVVLAADDVADGRSISTMLYATAAGAYLADEIRTTNGSLTALGLAALRVATGLSRRVLVCAWWLPRAPADAIARTSLDVAYGRRVVAPDRLAATGTLSACAACVVTSEPTAVSIEHFAFAQADYGRWLAGDGEPAGVLERLGRDIRRRSTPARARLLVPDGDWSAFAQAAGTAPPERGGPTCGVADGLVRLAAAASSLRGPAVVASTGIPPFLQAEAVVVRGEAGA